MKLLNLGYYSLSSVVVCLLLCGCGGVSDQPELGYVSGKVTLDGEPLAGVIISFQPDTGRAASDETDAEGHYDLEYRYKVPGCKVGPNTVSFAWPTGFEGGRPIPEKYAGRSELKVDVAAGSNEFDWDLKSK